MSVQAKTYLDYTGLTTYDGKIKAWSNSSNQKGYKTVLKSADGNNLLFYKKPNATLSDTADYTIALGSSDAADQINALKAIIPVSYNSGSKTCSITGLSNAFDAADTASIVAAINSLKSEADTNKTAIGTIGSLTTTDKTDLVSAINEVVSDIDNLDVAEFALASASNNVVTIKGIKENEGKIAVGTDTTKDIVFEEVAMTGAAADVSIADAGSLITATTVEGALQELAGNANGKAVYMTDNTSTSGTDYAQIYKIYQGTGSAASPVAGELVGTINIPKDQFVEEAALVDVTYNSTDGKLYDGSTDVTELIKGAGGTATAADAGKYVKLVFAITSGSAAKSTIYISVKALSHIYTGGSTSEISVSVNADTDVITASVVDIAATKITYIAEDQSQSIARESVGAALTRLDGADSVNGSVAKKIKTAIDALDTTSDVGIASYAAGTSGAADVITLTGSVKEVNGVIDQGAADTITLSTITETQINSLFA